MINLLLQRLLKIMAMNLFIFEEMINLIKKIIITCALFCVANRTARCVHIHYTCFKSPMARVIQF